MDAARCPICHDSLVAIMVAAGPAWLCGCGLALDRANVRRGGIPDATLRLAARHKPPQCWHDESVWDEVYVEMASRNGRKNENAV